MSPRQAREVSLKKRYGLTEETFSALLEAQGGRCALCGSVLKKPFVDHDHQTKKVRALLCPSCNTGLGLFGESAELLREAALYLDGPHA